MTPQGGLQLKKVNVYPVPTLLLPASNYPLSVHLPTWLVEPVNMQPVGLGLEAVWLESDWLGPRTVGPKKAGTGKVGFSCGVWHLGSLDLKWRDSMGRDLALRDHWV